MTYECIALTKTDLAEKIATALEHELHVARYRQFADGEVNVSLERPELFAGKTAVILQSTGAPVNEHTLGVAFLAQELKNAGAERIIAVVPYLGYARQGHSAIKRKPGSIAVIAKLFESSGIDELIVVDLHDENVVNFFSIPVYNLKAQKIIADQIKKELPSLSNTCLIAPDKGAAEYVQQVADMVKVGTLTFSKERFAVDQTRVLGHEGSCSGTTGIMLDDIIATGGTAVNVCNALPAMGYQTIYGYFVHPVLAGPAIERIEKSAFSKIFVSNTLSLSKAAMVPKIAVFDVSAILVDKINQLLMDTVS